MKLVQPAALELPNGILLRTSTLPAGTLHHADWIGVHLRDIVTLPSRVRRDARRLRSQFREKLRAPRGVRLIAILNGEDDELERLWKRDREILFSNMKAAGIHALTGPTFSIVSEGGDLPASHNLTMLHRHHRFCAEAHASGIIAIPNLYFRNRNEAERWTRHLIECPDMRIVSRDFTRTKGWSEFRPEFEMLLDVLRAVPRNFRVVLVGVGTQKLQHVATELAKIGANFTIASSRPVVAPPKDGDSREQVIAAFFDNVEQASRMALSVRSAA